MPEYVLAYDGGCSSCSETGAWIESYSRGRVTARNLRDPDIQTLRRKALGAQARWEPVLLRVTGDRVQGWTGRAMMVRVAYILGPLGAMRVAETVRAPQPADQGRRRFLRALPGAAAAALFLSGSEAWADAREPNSLKVQDISASDRRNLVQAARQHPDFVLLQQYLVADDYVLEFWDAKDALDSQGTRLRSVAGATFIKPGSEEVILAYGEQSDGTSFAYAIAGEGDDKYALTVDSAVVRRLDRSEEVQAQAAQVSCVDVCLAVCNVGCSCCSCGLICVIVCAANPVCAIICSGICAAVCGFGVCNRPACESVC